MAIISHHAGVVVPDDEVTALAAAYETLRGPGDRRTVRAPNAVAVAFTPPWPSGSVEEVGGSWVVAAGTPRHPGSLVGAPLDTLDGQFALVGYDADARATTVATDPFGLRGVYVTERDDRTYASTSLLALASHLGAAPDRSGVHAFLLSGAQFGTQTAWEGIERLEPGTSLRVGPAGRHRTVYWRPQVDAALRSLRFDQVVDRCLEIGLETRRAYAADRPVGWADLTAGYDSRLNTLLLRRAGVPFDACTRGERETSDVRLGREVARQAGWAWSQISLPSRWAEEIVPFLDRGLGWGDGQLDAVMLAADLRRDAARAPQHRLVFTGGGGELLRNNASQQEFRQAGRTTRVNMDNYIDMRLLHPMDLSVLADDPRPAVREDFRRRMTAWAAPYAGEPNTTQLDAMYIYKGTGHFGAFTSSAACYLEADLPFFAKELASTVMSIDFRHRREHRLVRETIHRLDPRIAAIPTNWGGPAEPRRLRNLHRFLPFYADVARRAANKISERTIGKGFKGSRRPIDERAVAARRALLASIQPFGHVDLRSAPLYREGALDAFLRRAQDADFRGDALLGRIITVELGLRAAGATLR